MLRVAAICTLAGICRSERGSIKVHSTVGPMLVDPRWLVHHGGPGGARVQGRGTHSELLWTSSPKTSQSCMVQGCEFKSVLVP